MVISSKDTREVVERWQFNILLERNPRYVDLAFRSEQAVTNRTLAEMNRKTHQHHLLKRQNLRK